MLSRKLSRCEEGTHLTWREKCMLRIYPRAAPTYNPMDNVAVMEGNEVGRVLGISF